MNVFGLFHGLLFLPVALSLFGPSESSGSLGLHHSGPDRRRREPEPVVTVSVIKTPEDDDDDDILPKTRATENKAFTNDDGL